MTYQFLKRSRKKKIIWMMREYFVMSHKLKKKDKATNVSKSSKEELAKDGGKFASFKPRKKPAPRLLSSRV